MFGQLVTVPWSDSNQTLHFVNGSLSRMKQQNVRQFSSSELSPQSLIPSQASSGATQLPLAQVKLYHPVQRPCGRVTVGIVVQATATIKGYS